MISKQQTTKNTEDMNYIGTISKPSQESSLTYFDCINYGENIKNLLFKVDTGCIV